MIDAKPGDTAVREMCGEMPLKVTEVTDKLIICGPWQFDRATGAEVDEELGWGPEFGCTGSYLVRIIPQQQEEQIHDTA